MALVVGTDEVSDEQPGSLQYVATDLFSLRERGAEGWAELDPALADIASFLEAELTVLQGRAVPDGWNRGVPCAVYSVLCYRALLPDGMLSRSLLPVLVGDDPNDGALVVPSEYWDDSLKRVWGS